MHCPERPLNGRDWETVESIYNRISPDFKPKLFSIGGISEQEYRVCLLIRLDVGNNEIGVLLGRTTSAISLARKRLYSKIFGIDGTAKELDEYIKRLRPYQKNITMMIVENDFFCIFASQKKICTY